MQVVAVVLVQMVYHNPSYGKDSPAASKLDHCNYWNNGTPSNHQGGGVFNDGGRWWKVVTMTVDWKLLVESMVVILVIYVMVSLPRTGQQLSQQRVMVVVVPHR